MIDHLKPLKTASLKDVFIERFEELIFSGAVAIGAKLPAERALAAQLGVSRPVVHEGLVELAARGLVTMTPRVGTVVNDYRKEGSLAALNSLIGYRKENLEPSLLEGMLDFRQLMETATARLAAHNRSDDDLDELRGLLSAEREADPREVEQVADLDFALHHRVALASGNPIYPMLINSCEPTYKCLTSLFFTAIEVRAELLQMHERLVDAISDRDAERAGQVMERLLDHGRQVLCRLLEENAEEAATA